MPPFQTAPRTVGDLIARPAAPRTVADLVARPAQRPLPSEAFRANLDGGDMARRLGLVARGAMDTVGGALSAGLPPELTYGAQAMQAIAGLPVSPRPAFPETGQAIEALGARQFPTTPAQDAQLGTQFFRGVGSTLPFLALGGLPSAARGVAGALMGEALGRDEAADRAAEADADPADALIAERIGGLAGLTDMAPVELLLRRLGGGGVAASMLHRIVEQALVEGGQEGAAQAIQNLAARATYAPDQPIGEGVGQAAVVGGAVGGVLGGAVDAVSRMGVKRGTIPPPDGGASDGQAPQEADGTAPGVPPRRAPSWLSGVPRQLHEALAGLAPRAGQADRRDRVEPTLDIPSGPAAPAAVEPATIDVAGQRRPVTFGDQPHRALYELGRDIATGQARATWKGRAGGLWLEFRGFVEGVNAPNAVLRLARDYYDDIRDVAETGRPDGPVPGGSVIDPETRENWAPSASAPPAGAGAAGVAPEPPSAAAPARPPLVVRTPRGTAIEVVPEVVDLARLIPSHTPDLRIDPRFPAALQPRDRTRAASEAQIARIAADIRPELLAADIPLASDGAPIVGDDGVVESGNARVIALTRAYGDGRAEHYRAWLAAQGYNVEGMAAPILVRRRATPMTFEERAAFAREANERSTLDMSEAERGMADAEALDDATLGAYQGGDIDATVNAPFVRAAVAAFGGAQGFASGMDAEGRLTQAGMRRIENAIFARAYGDARLLAGLREARDTNIASIGTALVDVAAPWTRLRRAVRAGSAPARMDITDHLLEAAQLVDRARQTRTKIADALDQLDIERGAVHPITNQVVRLFYNADSSGRPTTAASRVKIAARLRHFIEQALQTSDENMFGLAPVPVEIMLATARDPRDGELLDTAASTIPTHWTETGEELAGSERAGYGSGPLSRGETRQMRRLAGGLPGSNEGALADLRERGYLDVKGRPTGTGKRAARAAGISFAALPETDAGAVGSPAFNRWFGQSVVVNPDGSPKVVYRGRVEQFEGQDALMPPPSKVLPLSFFSSDPDVASDYVERQPGANILPAYLSLQNPFVLDAKGAAYDGIKIDQALVDRVRALDRQNIPRAVLAFFDSWIRQVDRALNWQSPGPDSGLERPEPAAYARLSHLAALAHYLGHDGLIVHGVVDVPLPTYTSKQSSVYVTLRPSQAKSIFNRGTWSPDDDRVSYSRLKTQSVPAHAYGVGAPGRATTPAELDALYDRLRAAGDGAFFDAADGPVFVPRAYLDQDAEGQRRAKALQTIDIQTPEREAMRAEWQERIAAQRGFWNIEDMLDAVRDSGPVKHQRIAYLIMGPPAAGKSTLANKVLRQIGGVLVDSDEFKQAAPEFDNGLGAAQVHEESAVEAKRLLDGLATTGANIVHPLIGSEKNVSGLGDLLEAAGYTVHHALVDLPPTKYIERASKRFLGTGRVISIDYLTSIGDRPIRSLDYAKRERRAMTYLHASSDVPYGQPFTIIEEIADAEGYDARLDAAGRGRGLRRSGDGGPVPHAGAAQALGIVAARRAEPDHRGGAQRGTGEAPGEAVAASRLPPAPDDGALLVPTAEEAQANREARVRDQAEQLRRHLEMRARSPLRARKDQDNAESTPLFGSAQGTMFSALPGTAQLAPGPQYTGRVAQAVPRPPTDAQLAADPIRRDEIIRDLMAELRAALYQGGVRHRKAEGFYRKKIEEIRVRARNDIEVVAHEVAHMIDDRDPNLRKVWHATTGSPAIRAELEAISYDMGLIHEGFAEFIRHWMTQPDEAIKRAPETFKWWEAYLTGKPFEGTLRDAQARMTAYWDQHPLKRLESKIGEEVDVNEGLIPWSGELRQGIFNDLWGGERMVRDLTGEFSDYNPAVAAYLSRSMFQVVEGAMRWGAPVVTGTHADGSPILRFDGPGLFDILKPIRAGIDAFAMYVVAKRAVGLRAQGRENLLRPDEIAAGLALETPEREAVRLAWVAFNRKVLDFAQEMGVIDPDARAAWETDVYVPFYRATMKAAGWSGQSRQVPGLSSPIRMLTGGTGNLRDIVANMVGNTSMLIQAGMLNHVRAEFAKLARTSKGGARFMVRVPTTSEKVRVASSQIADIVAGALGVPRSDPAMQAIAQQVAANVGPLAQFWLHGRRPRNDNLVAVMERGKPVYYEVVDPLLYRALTRLKRPARDPIYVLSTSFKRVAQWTVTFTLDFILANLARDTLASSVFSRYGAVPFKDAALGMLSRLREDANYRNAMANGLGFAGKYRDEDAMRRRLEAWHTRQGTIGTLMHAPQHIGEFLATLAEASEMASRLGERRLAIKAGKSDAAASYAAREVATDFARRGDWPVIEFLIDHVMFLNPALQSIDRFARGLASDPQKHQIAWKIGAVAIGSMILAALNSEMSGGDYDELEDWDKDANWHFFIPKGWLGLAHDPADPTDKPYIHARYPKIWEIGAIASIAERSFLAMATDAKMKAGDVARILIDVLYLDPIPTALRPPLELAMNKSLFTGRAIETHGMRGRLWWERSGPSTNRSLAELTEQLRGLPPFLSAPQIEHLIRGYTNTYGVMGLSLLDHVFYGDVLPDAPIERWWVIRRFSAPGVKRTRYVTELESLVRAATETQNSIRSLVRKYDEPLATEVAESAEARTARMLLGVGETQRNIWTAKRQVTLSPTIEETRQMARSITSGTPEGRRFYDKLRLEPDWADNGALKLRLLEWLQVAENTLAKSAVERVEALEGVGQDAR